MINKIYLELSKIDSDTDDYNVKSIEEYHYNATAVFGIKISFERNSKATYGIIINYYLMCAMLVLVASINFVIDPKVVPGRAGMLVTLFLVLTKFFSDAQVSFKKSLNLENNLL